MGPSGTPIFLASLPPGTRRRTWLVEIKVHPALILPPTRWTRGHLMFYPWSDKHEVKKKEKNL